MIDIPPHLARELERIGKKSVQDLLQITKDPALVEGAASDYSQNWMNQRNDQWDALRQQMAQFSVQDAQAQAGYADTEAEIELAKQRDILSTAASLQGLRPFLGA